MSGNSRKRLRPSTEDANNSFVQSVTSKMTGLLPATISKWFSGAGQSSSNGSAPTAEVTDSSSDEEPEIPSPITQPPQKRIRYSSPRQYNTSEEINCPTYSNESPEPRSYSAGPTQLQKFARDPNMVSTPFRPPNEEPAADRSERDSTMSNSSFSYSTLGPPVINKRKSLFKTSTSNDESMSVKPSHNTIVDPKQPCFKPSLLVSPFYPSRTTYGGASSQYINRPNIKQRKGTYVNELNSNESTTMSQSARRIMDLLEDYSSPIMEAKRIPQYTRPSINTSVNTSQSSNNKSLSYKTSELHSPNIASILRLKQKSRLMNTTNAARQIIASHSSASQYAPYSVNPIHRRLRTQSIGTNTEDPPRFETSQENDGVSEITPTIPPVSVSSAALPINNDNLPKFTFGKNLPIPGSSSTPKPNSSKVEKVEKTTPKVSEPATNPVPCKKIIIVVSNTETSPSEKKDIEKSEITKTKDWKCSDCWVENKPDANKCVCCGGKKPSAEEDKSVKCSVCKLANRQSHIDKCVNCEKVPTSISFNSTPLINSVKSSKWKCSDCWVENDESKDKCVCCGSNNPKKSSLSIPAVPVKAAADSDWTCDDCWIKNKSSVDKCAACGGTKPGSKQNAVPAMPTSLTHSTMFKPVDNKSFKPLIASQNDKWECTSCLVRNDNDKVKCVCCEMERPGAEKKIVKSNFNFGTATNTFKFGIDNKVQETNLAKAPEIKSLEEKLEESEKNNNILSKAPPTFSFGIPAKKPEDQVDSTKNETPVFTATTADSTFGVQTTKFTMPEFTFKKPENKDDNEKLQEVPKVDFSLPAPTSLPVSKPFGGMLNTSSTSTPSTVAHLPEPSIATSLLNPTSSPEKKNTHTTQLPFQLGSAVTSPSSPTQNKFMFSGGLKPAMNLFAKPPSSTPTTSLSFASPAQSAPTTTAASLFQKPPEATSNLTLSLFQKNETSTNSPLSLFQKPSTATTTVAPSLASTAPVFSFGTATKPASTFNFGASQSANMNDSTSNNSFKFFGTTPDKNAGSNKFNLGGVTSLGGSNSLTPGNILGSGNGLSSGNTLGSSLSGANSITSGNSEMPVQSNQNDLQSGSSIQSPAPSIFGAPAQKENIWSQPSSPSNNLFGTNNAANSLQKPGAFTFGASSTAFGAQPSNPSGPSTAFGAQPSNSSAVNTAFGAQSSNPTAPSTAFGAQPSNPSASSTAFGAQPSNPAASNTPFSAQPSNPAPVFGNNAQPTQNLFGMGNQNQNNTRSLFSSPVQSQPAQSLFGGSQPASTPAPAMGMFGSPAVGSTNTFGSPNQSLPSFDSSALTSTPAPAFNFGAQPSQTPVVFGFGQQPQAQQQPQQQIYSFGAATNSPQLGMGAAPQVQFNMGSSPAMRRVRKAVRRNPQR